MPSNHLILCHPLLLLPSIFTSIRVFSSESALHIRCSLELWCWRRLLRVPWTARRSIQSIIKEISLLKLMSIESVMPCNHLILCRPLLLLPSVFPSIRVFSNESVIYIRWPKDWSFSFIISPSNAYSGLISFRMDWLDLLAV